MYVSKNLILGLLLAGAGLLGWSSQVILAQLSGPAPAVALAPLAARDAANGPVAQVPQPAPDQALQENGTTPATTAGAPDASDSNVYMTIVNSTGGSQTSEPVKAIATATATSASTAQGARATGRAAQAVAYAPAAGPTGPVGARGATGPVGPRGNGQGQPQVSVNGNNITIATTGAVVMIGGDNGSLNANTGDTAASGTVAIDAQGSTLQSGASTVETSIGVTAAPGTTEAVQAAALAGSASIAGATGTTTTGIPTHSNSSFDSALAGVGGTGTSVSIAGFEDHSVSVIGDDHLVTYDDSNVFINRDGQVNANTGDTDSSGLNVVDAIDSVVRSGNSGDGEGNDDEEEEDSEEEVPVPGPVVPGDEDPSADPDDSVEDDDSADGTAEMSAMTMSSLAAPFPLASASVDDEDVATTATGSNAFVVGADGYDDVSIRVWGNRDVVTYDDSNVVIGGTGDVNAQIGDSDTAGAVVMGVRNSYIQAGCEGDLCYSGQTPAP